MLNARLRKVKDIMKSLKNYSLIISSFTLALIAAVSHATDTIPDNATAIWRLREDDSTEDITYLCTTFNTGLLCSHIYISNPKANDYYPSQSSAINRFPTMTKMTYIQY